MCRKSSWPADSNLAAIQGAESFKAFSKISAKKLELNLPLTPALKRNLPKSLTGQKIFLRPTFPPRHSRTCENNWELVRSAEVRTTETMGIFTHCQSCLLTQVQFWGNLQVSCNQEYFVKGYNECYCFPYMKPWNSRQSGRLSTLQTQNCCLFPLQHFPFFFFPLKKQHINWKKS